MYVCMYVCTGVCFMALIADSVSGARSRSSFLSVPVRRLHVVFSTAGFKGGEKPCSETRETTTTRKGILKASRTWLGLNQAIGALVHGFTH